MARPSVLLLSLCVALAFCGGLARQTEQFEMRDECQLNRLEANEPDSRVECEGGTVESWNPNREQFQCTGVALTRTTMEPKGLHLPSYTNAPQLVHIIQGRGILGVTFPGCPETFEESQLGAGPGAGSRTQQDRHQKLRHVREGDIVAIPAGVAYWSYNDGDNRLVFVTLLDVSNHNNQLDRSPRRFYLAGNPHDEFHQSRREEQMRTGRRTESIEQSPRFGESTEEGFKNNIFSGFGLNFLQEAFNIDSETARRIQNPNDRRGSIILVRDQLRLVRPHESRAEQEHERREQELRSAEREHGSRRNGVEETMCTMRIRENIGDPARADVFSPRAGRLATVNSFNLPILNWLQLSAERGFLYSDAMYAPHWNMNAHSVIYVIRGRARCQVVNSMGRSVFDGELRQGQALTVPQNFAIVKKAEKEGFEWVSFKTNQNAKVNQLAGKVSFMRALPDNVVANMYRISNEQARRLKYNRQETTLFRANPTSETERMSIVA